MLPSRITREEIRVDLAPAEVAERLAAAMSRVESLLFTVTWGLTGDFVGRVDGDRFQMRVRHAYSNGYTRLLFGTIEPAGDGSLLRLEFRDVRFVVVLMNLASAVVGIGALAFALSTARYASRGGEIDWSIVAAGLAGPVTVLVVFLLVEIVGRHLGRRDERRMREHLQALFAGAR